MPLEDVMFSVLQKQRREFQRPAFLGLRVVLQKRSMGPVRWAMEFTDTYLGKSDGLS